MGLRIRQDELESFIAQSSFNKNGDGNEQLYSELILDNFPRCEEFWRMFIVPITRRIDIPGGKLEDIIRFRDGIDPQLISVASIHYSVFMHLVYAHLHYKNPTISKLENIFAHLATVCDLAEGLIEKWHLLLLKCRGQPSGILQALSRDDFLKIAGEWYDKKYAQEYDNYYARGKSKPIDVLKGKNLLREYYGDSVARKDYARFSNKIREFRNAVVHDVKLAMLITSDGVALIPSMEKISQYRTWNAVQDISNQPEVINRDFIELDNHIQESIYSLEVRLNNLWEKLINDGEEEFNSGNREAFRSMFGIEFSDKSEVYYVDTSHKEVETVRYYPYSGMYPRLDLLDLNQPTSGSPGFPAGEDESP